MQRLAMIGVLVLAARIAAADGNHCELAVTGEATASLKYDAPNAPGQGNVTAGTDYWMTDAQLRAGLEMLQGLGSKETPAEKAKKVDAAMKQDPRFVVLMINCLGDDGGVIFGPVSKTKYADVPFKPGTYSIVGKDRGAKPGEYTVMFHLQPGGKRESYQVTTPGKLVLTQFDKKGIAGTFTFGATQTYGGSKKVTVTGSFRYACVGDACVK